jgi:hypothetical protein
MPMGKPQVQRKKPHPGHTFLRFRQRECEMRRIRFKNHFLSAPGDKGFQGDRPGTEGEKGPVRQGLFLTLMSPLEQPAGSPLHV